MNIKLIRGTCFAVLVLQGEKEENKMISVEMEDVLAVLELC